MFCTDGFVKHGFSFIPAHSLFATCESDGEIRRLSTAPGVGGAELMPLGNCEFSRQFPWVNVRFGVSWQLNLE